MRRFLLTLAAFLALSTPAWAAPPALDASGKFTNTVSSVSSGTVSITTTSSGDIILLFVICNRPNTAFPNVSSVSGGGLTWALRKQTQNNYGGATNFQDLEIWWAFSAGTQSAATITITFNTSIDDAAFWIMGITNPGSSSAPFDPNGGLPASTSHTTPSATVTVPITTSFNSNFIFMLTSTNQNYSSVTNNLTCSGWTQGSVWNNGGVRGGGLAVTFHTFSAPQTALGPTYWNGNCSTPNFQDQNWMAIGDSITNGGLSSVVTTRTLMGVGQ